MRVLVTGAQGLLGAAIVREFADSDLHAFGHADLDVAYSWLYHNWLPQSGREPGDAPCFEEYLNDPRSLPPQEWLTAVNLPLKG